MTRILEVFGRYRKGFPEYSPRTRDKMASFCLLYFGRSAGGGRTKGKGVFEKPPRERKTARDAEKIKVFLEIDHVRLK